jgi:hypothetical protein
MRGADDVVGERAGNRYFDLALDARMDFHLFAQKRKTTSFYPRPASPTCS